MDFTLARLETILTRLCLGLLPKHAQLIAILTLIVASHTVIAAPLLELKPNQSSPKNLRAYVEYLIFPPTKQVQSAATQSDQIIEEFEAINTQGLEFSPLASPGIVFGYQDKPVWIRLKVRNSGNKENRWILQTGIRIATSLTILKKSGESVSHLLDYRPSDAFTSRPINSRKLTTPVALASGEVVEIYLRIESFYGIRFLLRFLSPADFQASEVSSALLYGAVVGGLLLLVVFNLNQAIVLKSKLYYSYVVMVFSHLLFFTQQAGYHFQYFWPNLPGLEAKAPSFFFLFYSITLIELLRRLFETKRFAPRLHQTLEVMIWAYGVCFVLMWFTDLQELTKGFGQIAPALSLAMVSSCAYFAIKSRVYNAWYYTAGVACSSISLLLFYFVTSGTAFFHWEVDGIIFLSAGVILEGVIFSFALSQRVRALHLKNEKNKRERIQILEERLADVGNLKKLEDEKRQAIAEKRKNALQMAEVSHDIRQPLFSIRSTLAFLKDEVSNEDAVKEIDGAIDYAESLLRQNLQDTQAQDDDKKTLVSLGQVFNELFKYHYREAKNKNLILRFMPSTLYFNGSATITLRILSNIVKNAIQCTQSGKILCGVRRRVGAIEIQVIDTGPGIEKEQKEKILEPFARGDSLDEYEGYGLGLSIVKSLCEKENYRLALDSTPGRGSVFSICIPT